MSEITKDFIKFLAEVVVFLMIVVAVFSPEGIASSTFNYMAFAEPILLQNFIATAFTFASQAPGEFSSNIKTSGDPHIIEIFKKNDIYYVNVIPATKTYTKTTFSALEPVPFVTNCTVMTRSIKLQSKLSQVVEVRKKINSDDSCTLYIDIVKAAAAPQCSDGLDNDGDSKCDFTGCSGMIADPECKDGNDNDEAS